MMMYDSLLQNEEQLLARCRVIEGFTFGQLAMMLSLAIPEHPLQRKGWVGQAVERALGASAGQAAAPDFHTLGIELKTMPMNDRGYPAQSTFITSIPLLTLHQQTWKTSQCFAKLQRVLWLPIESSDKIPFVYRRIGQAVLWSPSITQENILAHDWSELSLMISTGRVSEIDARMGEYLQVRPKCANARSLCSALNEKGEKIMTLPRGFYLRRAFTSTLL